MTRSLRSITLAVAATLTGCSLPVVPRAKQVAALTGTPASGAATYATDCRTCHGADGRGGSTPDAMHHGMYGALHDYSAPEVITVILQGGGTMPSFARCSDQELADLYAYLMSLPK
jgi:mono/diheme cytochrome c family protein